MPIQHANVGRRVRDELLAARFVQTLEQVRALQVEPQLELARQLRPADVFRNQRMRRTPFTFESVIRRPCISSTLGPQRAAMR